MYVTMELIVFPVELSSPPPFQLNKSETKDVVSDYKVHW